MKLGPMKITLVAAFLAMASQASAQTCSCNGALTRVTGTALSTLIVGQTACATLGGSSWQSYHQSGGSLIDYKKGPSDPVDPTKVMGTWSINSDKVQYNYGTGGVFEYEVCGTSSSATYCGASNIPSIRFLAGQGAC